ncbi:MAG: hypothetical protein NC823_00400 [Candidatus Omnitrophica bacterium]|nr:hypothetical protein [Candidatus Omnitrophota bacterium]
MNRKKRKNLLRFLVLLFTTWLLSPAQLAREVFAQEEISKTKQEEEARIVLIEFGLHGNAGPAGFRVERVKEKSLADKAGFKSGDTIRMVDEEIVNTSVELAAALRKYQTLYCVSSVILIAPGTVREIAWPPLEENNTDETGLNQARLNHALGSKALSEQNYTEAVGFLLNAISTSINYPGRAEVFWQLANCYSSVLKDLAEQERKAYSSIPPGMTLHQAKQHLSSIQQTAALVRNYAETARTYLRHLELEKMRAGAPVTSENIAQKAETLNQEIKQVLTAYQESFFPYQSAMVSYIDSLDFPRWLKGKIEAAWELYDKRKGVKKNVSYLFQSSQDTLRGRFKETTQPILEVCFAPVVTITLTNSSRQQTFRGIAEVQCRDSRNNLRWQTSQEVTLAPGEKKELIWESSKRFENSEVVGSNILKEIITPELLAKNLKVWQAELLVNGKRYGRVSIKF